MQKAWGCVLSHDQWFYLGWCPYSRSGHPRGFLCLWYRRLVLRISQIIGWGEVYTLCIVLGLQATGSFRGRSWGTWWWTWARCWPRRSAPAWSRFPSNSCNPATNRSQFINMSSRRDICSKFYTTWFSGLKFDTVKVPNLRHCVLKDLTELILSFFIRESFSVLVQIGVFSWFRITFEYSSQNSVRQ